ncbi:unnamed protein product [Agarophyton chilense]
MASNPPQVAEVDVENPPPLAHGDSELNTKPAVKNLNRLTSCFRGERRVYGTGKSIPEEFRDFIFGGNLIRIAVAFILALALERMVEQFVASFITPIIGVIGAESFEDLTFTVRSSKFRSMEDVLRHHGLYASAHTAIPKWLPLRTNVRHVVRTWSRLKLGK